MTTYQEATSVTPQGDGEYAVRLAEEYSFGEAVNGGYLMGVLLRAAVAESPHAHPLTTAASFLRPAQPGPAQVVVEPRKTGRTAATARVSLVQNGKPIVDAMVTTGTLDPTSEPAYQGERPPIPPIEECRPSGHDRSGFVAQVDMRFDPAVMGWLDGEPSGRPEMRAHFRLASGEDPDPYVLALALDALVPVVVNTGNVGWSPTVDLTWHLRALPAPGWLTVHGGGRLVRDGWNDEDVEIWDSSGTLVAQSRQLARTARTRK
ncbi:thioesterase family protein [Actinocorallia sp. A-T 12471]|uniref:thioesterase family protein n=1 Tax=Actinocorallia sp. A-T 12471 TaxID=3089813 RepID=UPI0029D29C0A|nr:thioesterase family protein [Actinocorallia sp. A-T 12471]MDX6743684.1 thioesterase family protein [Actinocorallia sp. A-T 12471]